MAGLFGALPFFRDYLSEHERWAGIWTGFLLLAGLAIYLAISPRMAKGWRKVAVRTVGGFLALGLEIAFLPLMLGSIMAASPRGHTVFISNSGKRAALLGHTSYRDFATTQIAVEIDGCCTRYIAYDYYGDGDDFMKADSVTWTDDHELVIRYAIDVSGTQVCHAEIGDVKVVCDARSAPTFDDSPAKQK